MRNKQWLNVLTEEFLLEHHNCQHKSLNQIANEVGCDRKTVLYYIQLHEIPYQTYYPNRKLKQHSGWRGFGDIPMTYWHNLKNGAKTRQIPFAVSIEQAWTLYLRQKSRCALSGRLIAFIASKKSTASLDRIDSSRGYELDNIQWVHVNLNYAKQQLNNQDFISLCCEVVQHQKKCKIELPRPEIGV